MRSCLILAACIFLVGACRVPAWTATQHQSGHFELRTVQGTVFNSEAIPARSAVVYLNDARTHSIKTYITDEHGHYRFVGLFPSDDYEVYADRGGLRSKKHNISGNDERSEFIIDLKISHREQVPNRD